MKFNLPKEPLMSVDNLPFKKIAKGKVRENFDLGDELLIVATDRISAFDSIMPNGVPGIWSTTILKGSPSFSKTAPNFSKGR